MKIPRSGEQVLRQVVVQTQSRPLARPGVASAAPASRQTHAERDEVDAALRAQQAQQEKQLATLADEARKRGFDAGRREGLAKGLEEGKAEAQRQCEAYVTRLENVVAAIGAARPALAQAVEDDMVELALACLGQLLSDRLALPDVVQALVRQQIERYSSEGIVSIRLSPEDHALLSRDGAFAAVLAKHAPSARWVADAGVEAGGCIIETGAGAIDARIETQLDQIKACLVAVGRDRGRCA
ncbi:MAG: FliH/SctL family protein [Rhodocyclaceae bacterium]